MRIPIKFWMAALVIFGGSFQAVADDPNFTRFPVTGARGDRSATPDCYTNHGGYMVGLRGAVGAWVDRAGPLCAGIEPGGTRGSVFGDVFGGNGGAATSMVCAGDSVMYGWKFQMTKDNRQVKSIEGLCRSIRTGQPTDSFFFSAPDPCSIGGTFIQTCPADQLAVSFVINYGVDVNALGLQCGPVWSATIAPFLPIPTGKPMTKDEIRTEAENIIGEYFDLPGADYRSFPVSGPRLTPDGVCQEICFQDAFCKAWTATRGPGNAGTCWLKSSLTTPVKKNGVTSGIPIRSANQRPK